MSDDEKLPTDKGELTPEEIVHSLHFSSYCAQRQYGLSPEELDKLGFPDVKIMEVLYIQRN